MPSSYCKHTNVNEESDPSPSKMSSPIAMSLENIVLDTNDAQENKFKIAIINMIK